MIRKPSAYDSVSIETYTQLPKGGYIGKIMGTEIRNFGGKEMLVVSTDITEGEYANYWASEYRAQTSENRYWRSQALIEIPYDGCDEKTVKKFKRFITKVEECNPAFHWDWDETKLKGCAIGCVYYISERVYNGKKYTSTKLSSSFATLKEITNGTFWAPEDALLTEAEKAQLSGSEAPAPELSISNDELPF